MASILGVKSQFKARKSTEIIGLGLVAERQGLSFKNPENHRNSGFPADTVFI